MSGFNIFNELSEHISIKINSCHEISHEYGWMESKIHYDYDIWYITTGEIRIETNNSVFTAHTGDVILFYPDSLYTTYTTDKNCNFIYIHFEFAIGNNYRLLNDFNLAGIIPGKFIQEQTLLFQKGYDEFQKKTIKASLLLKGCLTILLAEILQICGNKNILKTFSKDKQGISENLVILQPVLEYIHLNIHQPFKTNDLASIAGMSEKYFITYFKKTLGITPGQYIFQFKMNRARDYIQQKKYSVKEIAHALGYPDQYTFSKAFKRFYCVSPSKFI